MTARFSVRVEKRAVIDRAYSCRLPLAFRGNTDTMPITVTHKQQMDCIIAVLRGLGANEEEAFIQADVWTEADLRGIHSHGVQRLPVMVTRIQKGLLKVNAKPEKTWSTDSVLNIDGKDGFGTAICELGLRELVPAARKQGVAVMTVRNAAHIGMVGYYAERRALEGFRLHRFHDNGSARSSLWWSRSARRHQPDRDWHSGKSAAIRARHGDFSERDGQNHCDEASRRKDS